MIRLQCTLQSASTIAQTPCATSLIFVNPPSVVRSEFEMDRLSLPWSRLRHENAPSDQSSQRCHFLFMSVVWRQGQYNFDQLSLKFRFLDNSSSITFPEWHMVRRQARGDVVVVGEDRKCATRFTSGRSSRDRAQTSTIHAIGSLTFSTHIASFSILISL